MTKANTGNSDHIVAHDIEVITEYPECVATFRIGDGYGYGVLNADGVYLVRAQGDDIDRMEVEAGRFCHTLAVDRGWVHVRDGVTFGNPE